MVQNSGNTFTEKEGMMMKKIMMVFIVIGISTMANAQMDNPLKKGMLNTVEVSNGDLIYDLNGEWDVSVEHYGPWAQFGVVSDVSAIKQDGASFVGITLLGSPRSPKGSEKLRGELDKIGFKKVYTITGAGPVDLNGEILNNGDKLLLDDGTKIRLTYTRKK
jgi:hypothetical protein